MRIGFGEVMEFLGVGFQIKQHWAEATFGVDQFKPPVKDHEQPRIPWLEPEFHTDGGRGIIIFADRKVAPIGRLPMQPGG